MPGQVSSVSTPRDTGEVMMEQLCFPWHSSSTVLRAATILQEKPFNTESLQSLPGQLMAANPRLAITT